jgi:hypothetical protein
MVALFHGRFMRRYGAFGASTVGALMSLVMLRGLPGRSTSYARASVADSLAAPDDRGNFEVGSVHWPTSTFKEAASLAPLRRFFADACGIAEGLDAARCVSDRFALAFRHGAPEREFLGPEYDPVIDLQRHLDGQTGLCVTRSGLASAVLLSAGIPARQVQLVPARSVGHNAFEVWDARYGWVLFDPTFGTALYGAHGPIAATHVLSGKEKGTWRALGLSPAAAPQRVFDLTSGEGTFSLRYPEPWLYTRAGERSASWPFRGLLVTVGEPSWDGGPAQDLWRTALLLSTAMAIGAGVWAVSGRRRTADTSADEVVVESDQDAAENAAA